jgi:hypothetical protein
MISLDAHIMYYKRDCTRGEARDGEAVEHSTELAEVFRVRRRPLHPAFTAYFTIILQPSQISHRCTGCGDRVAPT